MWTYTIPPLILLLLALLALRGTKESTKESEFDFSKYKMEEIREHYWRG